MVAPVVVVAVYPLKLEAVVAIAPKVAAAVRAVAVKPVQTY